MKEMRLLALIVEDDPAARRLLASLVESLDFDADVAADGEEALRLIGQREYDVILLDIVLPKVSGIEVMEALQHSKPRTLSRIIVVTGLDLREIRTLFAAVHETLSKPVLPARLRAAVRSCVAPRPSGSLPTDEPLMP